MANGSAKAPHFDDCSSDERFSTKTDAYFCEGVDGSLAKLKVSDNGESGVAAQARNRRVPSSSELVSDSSSSSRVAARLLPDSFASLWSWAGE